MVGDIFMAGIPRKLQAFGEVEPTPGGGGEAAERHLHLHPQGYAERSGKHPAGRTFVVLPLAPRRESTL